MTEIGAHGHLRNANRTPQDSPAKKLLRKRVRNHRERAVLGGLHKYSIRGDFWRTGSPDVGHRKIRARLAASLTARGCPSPQQAGLRVTSRDSRLVARSKAHPRALGRSLRLTSVRRGRFAKSTRQPGCRHGSPAAPQPGRCPSPRRTRFPGKKRARHLLSKMPGKYLATTYSRKTCRLTTIGAAAFHFRVRNGTGWFHRALVTRGRPFSKRTASLGTPSRSPIRAASTPACTGEPVRSLTSAWSFRFSFNLNSSTSLSRCAVALEQSDPERNQAKRMISTGKLHILLRFHFQPINVVVFHDPYKENLS